MIKSIYTIGKILEQEDDYKDYFRPWENPFPKLKINETTTVIVAEIIEGELSAFLKEELFSREMVDKYLFRKALSNGTNLVPTFYLHTSPDAKIQEDNIRKMIVRVKSCVKNYGHKFITAKQIGLLEEYLTKHQYNGTRYLFTMRIDGKYFGDFDAYKDLFFADAYQKYSKGSSSTNKVCAVTYEQADVVWGRVDTLGFTVNDVAFSRNDFDTSQSYKMFPVSPDAVKILEGCKRIILEKLARNFFGMVYFVLPHFIGIEDNLKNEIVLDFFEKCSISESTLEQHTNSIFENENLINEIIKDDKLSAQSVYYDIFFYQPNKAQFIIKLQVSDVLPSRFRQILEAKNKVSKCYDLITQYENKKEKKIVHTNVTFSLIKNFFSEKTLHPFFFKIVEAVFYQNTLNKEQILVTFIKKIRAGFKNSSENPYDFGKFAKESFVIYQFFHHLGILKNHTMNTESNENAPVGLTLEAFELQHSDFLENPVKAAAFYMGCVVEKLLEKQRSALKSEPFRKNLNGLNVDAKILMRIMQKLQDKISQYDTAGKMYQDEMVYIQTLSVKIMPALLTTKDLPSKNEISYAFIMGMVMQKEFTSEKIRLAKIKKQKNDLEEN